MSPVAATFAAAQIGGAIFKGFGTWGEARTQVRGYKSRAEALSLDADAVERATKYDVSQMVLEARRLRARQLVQYAKSGVLMEGTPNIVVAESKAQAEKDTAMALDTGLRQAQRMRIQGAYERYMAVSAKIGGIFNVLAGVAQSASDTYTAGKKAGFWGKESVA